MHSWINTEHDFAGIGAFRRFARLGAGFDIVVDGLVKGGFQFLDRRAVKADHVDAAGQHSIYVP